MPLMRRGLVPDSAIDGIVSCIWLDADYLRRLRKVRPRVPIVFASLPRGWSPPKAGACASFVSPILAKRGAEGKTTIRGSPGSLRNFFRRETGASLTAWRQNPL